MDSVDKWNSGAWKSVHLKPYNFKAKGALTASGALHPRMLPIFRCVETFPQTYWI